LGIGAALLAGSAWLARYGSRLPQLEKPLTDLLTPLDFIYSKPGQPTRFGLNHKHFQVMLPIAVLGYMDAARDRLEFVEVAIRASTTAFFLGWGSRWLEAWATKRFGHNTPGLMTPDKTVKSMGTLLTEAITHAQKQLPSGTKEQRIATAVAYLAPKLQAKTQLYLLPVGFGMTVIGIFVALMNQFWTKYRYQAVHKEEAQFLARYHAANPTPLKRSMPQQPSYSA
jgi:hypothetical protein